MNGEIIWLYIFDALSSVLHFPQLMVTRNSERNGHTIWTEKLFDNISYASLHIWWSPVDITMDRSSVWKHPARGAPYGVQWELAPPGEPLAAVAPCSPYNRMGMCGSVYGYPASKISLDHLCGWTLCSYSPSFSSLT